MCFFESKFDFVCEYIDNCTADCEFCDECFNVCAHCHNFFKCDYIKGVETNESQDQKNNSGEVSTGPNSVDI